MLDRKALLYIGGPILLAIALLFVLLDRSSPAPQAAQAAFRGSAPAQLVGQHEALPPFGQGITMQNLVPRYTTMYTDYVRELWELHGSLRELCTKIACLTDDMEIEATYMRVREAKPSIVWEVSPHFGYSTFVILTALKRNGKGVLLSFDLEDDVSANLPADLTEGGRWQLVVGDFSKTYLNFGSQKPDYLFLDSMHTAAFGAFYTLQLLPWLGTHHIFCSLHDVYNPQVRAHGHARGGLPLPARSPHAPARHAHATPLPLLPPPSSGATRSCTGTLPCTQSGCRMRRAW